ncbi:MAG: NAD(P)/FAD-dependent oxidoreductase [Pseudomonadota bacterium]
MTERFDVVLVGAGHNGLIAAAELANAGRRVLVLEAGGQVGGACITREFADGFTVSPAAHLLYQLQPRAAKLLSPAPRYAARGLETLVLGEDARIVRYGGTTVTGVSEADRLAYSSYAKRMRRFSRLLWRWLNRVPPRLGAGRRRDTRRLLRMALELRVLGKSEMREFLRLIGANIYDDVGENFSSELLKGGLCLDAVLGTHSGPRSPNTIMTALYRLGGAAGAYAVPAGGMGSIANGLAMTARTAGVEIRTDSPVTAILVDNGRVTGVETADGTRIASYTVVSSADPKQTVFSLVGARHFETGFVRRLEKLRSGGNAAKLHLALDRLPDAHGLDAEQLGQRLLIAPGHDAVERAFNPAKYGQYSSAPVMEISIPSIHDETLAPDGQHVLSAVAQYAPYELDGGWNAEQKRRFFEICLDTLEAHLPGVRARIIEGELLTPVDLEEEFRMTGGHWHHAELALDQFLFTRPVPGAAQYRAPLDGLYLCGAGSHPGGGVSGAPGLNAARAVLQREGDQ